MTSALEDIKTINLDQWLTLATAPATTKLKPGQTPYAYNTWVDEKPGSVITANGYRKVGTLPSNNPGTFCINYFKTSSGTQTFVVSDNATVWTTVDFQNFTQIITGLSSAFQLRGLVIRDKLWLTNGNDAVRTFDGSTVTVLDGTGGTPNVPKGRYIGYHDERVWIGHTSSARSAVYFSALTDTSGNIITPDNSAAWPNSNFLQVSEGDADFLTGMFLYRGYMYFFKQYTIWRLVGYDEYSYTRVKTRASTGSRFNESIQILDSLIHMIGVDGIYVFDGEETDRISDIIDPATAEQASFGFNQIQQPNVNNQFWEASSTSDWNAGTVPQNLVVNNQVALQAKDDSQADFQAGTTLTNIDTTTVPGSIQLNNVAAGGSNVNISQGKTATLTDGDSVPRIGQPAWITDGVLTGQQVGFQNTGYLNDMFWTVDLGQAYVIGAAKICQLYSIGLNAGFGTIAAVEYSTNGSTWTAAASFTLPGAVQQSNGQWQIGPYDQSLSFNTVSARYWRFHLKCNQDNWTIAELQIFLGGFKSSGQFVSRAIDFGSTPNSIGNFYADYVLNGEGLTFQTQSSADGASWDSPVSVANGAAIASTPRRYLRWIANFTSDGNYTPVLSDAWVGSVYTSAIHDTGGSIYAWGAYEADYDLNGEAISFYYRGATTSGGVSAASWNLIVPGGAMNMSTTYRYIQFKFEIQGIYPGNNPPVVRSVTLNWVSGSGTQPQVLQNVASYYWRNRYWLSCAGAGATANNSILVRGKKTFGSPWQLKDWPILSFTRYLDNFYGTSSVDGSIYQLDTGYSKDGVALNSLFETGDFCAQGFQMQVIEIVAEVQRMGPYSMYIGHSTDQGQTWTDHTIDLTLATGAPPTLWKRINNISLTTDKVRLRFYTNSPDQPWQVHSCIIYYKLSVNRGTIGGN